MEAKGFFASLFDYSFSSFITPRIIKVLYVLATIAISLWTLFLIVAAFNVSDGVGAVMLVIGGPLFFVFSMIYARVFLELVIAFFRINGNVQEIRDERIGGAPQPVPTPGTPRTARRRRAHRIVAGDRAGPRCDRDCRRADPCRGRRRHIVCARVGARARAAAGSPLLRELRCGTTPGRARFCTSCGHV